MCDGNVERRVEIWVKIQKDSEGYSQSQDWEELWAHPLPDGSLQILNVTFFAQDTASGIRLLLAQQKGDPRLRPGRSA